MPFDRDAIKLNAAKLAAEGVFIGTSSWKHEGWLGATIAGGGATNYSGFGLGFNSVTGDFGTVGGGFRNTASGGLSTVVGGQYNTASGEYSFAAGQQAQAIHQGAFVWADSQNAYFASTTNDQFSIHAQGEVRLHNSTSIAFGNQTRQMLELYRDPTSSFIYGIGVQTATLYARTAHFGGFAWYQGGIHNDGQNNAGGGSTLMTLNTAGLTVNGTFVNASDRNLKENFQAVSAGSFSQGGRVAHFPLELQAGHRQRTSRPDGAGFLRRLQRRPG
jgi:hypothetical protein